MGRTARLAVLANAHFSFMKARYAGRYYRVRISPVG